MIVTHICILALVLAGPEPHIACLYEQNWGIVALLHTCWFLLHLQLLLFSIVYSC